jgi:hypothetical protein
MHRNPAPHLDRIPHLATIVLAFLAIGLLGIGPLAAAGAAASSAIGRDEAISIVTETQLGGSLEGVRLFVRPELLPAGETVSTWRRDVFVTPAQGWFLFVDRYPGANWEHPCWYLYVDAASGAVQRFEAMTPPRTLRELTEITRGHDNPPPGASEESLARFSERLRGLPKPPPARGQAWAFIISGGADASNNHIRYWNDCAFIYRTLVEYYGYADDHIRVCISDGTSPAVDRSDGTNSPSDLDGDGDADIEYPATLQYVGQVFGELASTLTASDQLFIFTTDHGGQESGHDCYLNLWNWEQLRDDQMAGYIATLPCAAIICTFEQCFSGGMVDDLAADGRVIATGANWDEYSWAMGPDYIYDTFVYHWTSAVAWETPAGLPVDADTSNDGIVSMQEAFAYAQANDHEDETPQYSSTPTALGDMLNLFGSMEGVYLAIDQITIDDDATGASHGNGDGVIDFGETIELTLALHNMGQSDALGVLGTLATGSSNVTLIEGARAYGGIPSGGTVSNPLPFVFSVANDVQNGESLALQLGVTESPGSLPLNLTAAAPSYSVEIIDMDDSGGDGDCIADPGETVGLKLRIGNHGGCCSPDLTGVLQGGGYFTADPTPHPIGLIHVGEGVDLSGCMVTIAPECPAIYSGDLDLALTAAGPYETSAGLLLWVGPWFDDAELDKGWTLGAAGDLATTGLWERSDPVGTTYGTPAQQVQPEDDHTAAPGHICFVTGNAAVGAAAGTNDVDGGKTTLLSPVFNVERATSVTLTYWRWYTNNLGNNPGQDYWDVDVTADGTNWVHLEHTVASANSWIQYAFDLGSFVPLTGTLRFRFVADDTAPGSLVEAAVDDITVSIVRTPAAGVEEDGTTFSVGLGVCRPNPIGSGAVLSYRLAARGPVLLELYDVAGRRVRTLFDGSVDVGEHSLSFAPVDQRGRRIPSGVYFVRMETPGFTQVRQVTVLR